MFAPPGRRAQALLEDGARGAAWAPGLTLATLRLGRENLREAGRLAHFRPNPPSHWPKELAVAGTAESFPAASRPSHRRPERTRLQALHTRPALTLRVRVPAAPLAAHVALLWYEENERCEQVRERVLPTGTVELVMPANAVADRAGSPAQKREQVQVCPSAWAPCQQDTHSAIPFSPSLLRSSGENSRLHCSSYSYNSQTAI